MSMFEALTPHPDDADRDGAPAAAEPGPHAPGVPAPEEPDVLPNRNPDDGEAPDVSGRETPFRTPTPGESLTVEELERRAQGD
jgi:hypothetical protein